VSVKTRAPRANERHGREYYFISEDAFDEMLRNGELLEWAPFVDHRSGTPRAFVEESLAAGRDIILEIDVKGAEQVRKEVPDAVLIFLAPPSMDELERRLRGRGTEDDERIARRLERAAWEMTQRSWFDHVVVNDDLERAADEVAAIIEASRTGRSPDR
jgi:guanylate kinase